MSGFNPNPSLKQKRCMSAKERKKVRKNERRAKQFAAAIGLCSLTAPVTHTSPDTGSFFTPATVQVVPPQEVAITYVDEVVLLNEPAPPLTIIQPRNRSFDDRTLAHRAHVALLERLLLSDLERSYRVPEGDILHGFAARLTRLATRASAEEALAQFALGEAYMRSLSDRLAAEPSEERLEPFSLYAPSLDGMGIEPTPEAIDAWEVMRHRLLRVKSDLGRKWSSQGRWSPWNLTFEERKRAFGPPHRHNGRAHRRHTPRSRAA